MILKFMIQQDLKIKGARIAILGLTFKENCPDLRNSKVKDIIELFMEYGLELFIHDPQAHSEELVKEFGINGTSLEKISDMDALVVCVPHKEYSALLPREILKLLNPRGILMDVKGIWSKEVFLESDIKYWRL
jgi:UDP-N-acetyl-D-galactosamine dehydrogenase